LVGTLAWLVWQFYLKQRIHFANLSVNQYSRYSHVPPTPYFENDAEVLNGLTGWENLDDFTTFESMSELTGRLDKIVQRPDRDLLVLYVSAHGISLDRGGEPEAYLLCNDFNAADGITKDGGGLPITDFLKQVKDCKAGVKIIILDAGHLSTEPRLGVIVNEFPALLEKAVKKIDDKDLWVLSANSMYESSHVSHARRQSIFNYFVVRGLTGDADGDGNNKVDLAELASFVGRGVRTWMESHYPKPETQTPKILWGGGDIERKDDIVARMRAVVLPIQRTKPTVAAEDAQKTEPTTPKASDPGKPKTESAVDAAPRDRGGLLGRLTRPSGVGLLSLAGGAAPEQPAAGPAAPAKAPGDAPPAASDSSVETAKSAPESKKADVGKAEPESKKAPPAAEPKAAAPTPDAADKTSSPDKAPQQGAVKKEKEDDKAARTKIDKWSSVRSRWGQRDALMRPVDSAGWTPIDFAPLHWRRFESEILDSEARYPDRDKKVEGGQILPADFDRERKKFLETNERREQSGRIHEALKTRNRAIYRAIDLVAWHARASWAQQEQLGEYEDIVKLLSDLAKLERSLAVAVRGPDDDEGTDAEDLESLESHRNAVANRLMAIENRLNEQASQAVQLVARDANTHGVARIIEDLLSIPLENTDLRISLLKALEQTGKVPEESKGEKNVAEAQILEEVFSPQKDSERREPWSRAIEQAILETMLADLAKSDASQELLKVIPQSNEGREGEPQQIRRLSLKLAQYYRELRLRIDKASESTPRAERERRLFPLALTADRPTKNPILDRHWLAPPKRGFEFDFNKVPDPLVLDPASEGTEIKGTLAAKGGFTGKVKLSLAFDSNKLKIDDISASDSRTVERNTSRNISFDSDHPSITLRYRVSLLDLPPRATTGLTLTAEATANSGQRETLPINFQSPTPDDINLVISPAASGEYLASEADLAGNLPTISGVAGATQSTPGAVTLSTFAGHVTSFLFKLKHDSGRKRTVSVDLLGVSGTDDRMQLERLRKLAKTNPEKLLEPQRAVKKLASFEKMELDAVEAGALIPFKKEGTPPADGKPASAASPAKDESKEPPPSIVDGLVLIVRDRAKPELGPWVTWIDVAPWVPWQYINPTVEYDGQKKLTVKLGLFDQARPLDGRGIKVALEESKEIRKADIIGPGTELNEKVNYKSQLEARVDRASNKQAEVRLNVDGYPRAFVYKISLDSSRPWGLDDREKYLTGIRIVQPSGGDYFKPPDDELDVRIEVMAPESSFREVRQTQPDRVELGIDKIGDGTIEPLATGYTDRNHEITVESIDANGRVSINTVVKELEFHSPSPELNKHAKLYARLILEDGRTAKDSVEVIFDDLPPNLKVLGDSERVVERGKTVLFEVSANDENGNGQELSGVKSVKFAVDKFDDKTREAAESVPLNPKTGRYELNHDIAPDFKIGPHKLYFWAIDNVELESDAQIVTLEVTSPPPAPGNKPGVAKKGKIEGIVDSEGKPVPNINVQMVEGSGNAASAKTVAVSDANGRFVIRDLEPGIYGLQAEGTYRNGRRKAPLISVPVKAAATANAKLSLQ
jgi:hypothetical protein